MENVLTISLNKNPYLTNLRLEKAISPEEIDYLHIEKSKTKKRRGGYLLTLKTKGCIPRQKVSIFLSEWILKNYKKELMHEVLKERFIAFFDDECEEILKIAESSMNIFDEIYCKKMLVKKISNYFKNDTKLSIEGFLRFRLNELKRLIEMVLSNAIDEFYIKEEYREFTKLLKLYLENSKPLIGLIHVKPDSNGNFLLFDIKKEEYLINDESLTPIENFLTGEDLILSNLIALAPKKIIWHEYSQKSNPELLKLLGDIFEEKFSICKGCDFCKR